MKKAIALIITIITMLGISGCGGSTEKATPEKATLKNSWSCRVELSDYFEASGDNASAIFQNSDYSGIYFPLTAEFGDDTFKIYATADKSFIKKFREATKDGINSYIAIKIVKEGKNMSIEEYLTENFGNGEALTIDSFLDKMFSDTSMQKFCKDLTLSGKYTADKAEIYLGDNDENISSDNCAMSFKYELSGGKLELTSSSDSVFDKLCPLTFE